ncbi:15974_t:CDS:2 [Racocetra fulgida]|uniref:15974_t:CDS:1 n=1 Tax=Racocetra fulgida TaxID=60492 RepID=A0A9N9C1G0_9GLOM|nr:15974_t:CDS:2 [Racocetra fulgida]
MPNELKLTFYNSSSHSTTNVVESTTQITTQIDESNLETSISLSEISHECSQLVQNPILTHEENSESYILNDTWVNENIHYENVEFRLDELQDLDSLVFNHLWEVDPETWREEDQYVFSEESQYGVLGETSLENGAFGENQDKSLEENQVRFLEDETSGETQV